MPHLMSKQSESHTITNTATGEIFEQVADDCVLRAAWKYVKCNVALTWR